MAKVEFKKCPKCGAKTKSNKEYLECTKCNWSIKK
jgi:DNA-directed RNA polymerase subunit RPC12/RpoP